MNRIAVIALSLVLLAGAARAETRFLVAIDDVPLAPTLQESAGEETVFTEPEGRIVEASAHGAGEAEAIRTYYLGALPALGWTLSSGNAGDLAFSRGGERLRLRIDAEPGGVVSVRFRLAAPQPAPGLKF